MNHLLLRINQPRSRHDGCYKELTAHRSLGALFDFLVPSSELFRVLNQLEIHNVPRAVWEKGPVDLAAADFVA